MIKVPADYDRPTPMESVPGAWLAACLVGQILLMLVVVCWNYCDPRLERLSLASVALFRATSASEFARLPATLAMLMGCLLWCAILCGAFSVSALFWASGGYRSIRYMGLLCVLCALWLSIFTQWERIAWLGHRHRASVAVTKLSPLALQLSQEWPKYDGQSEHLGPFMAYPNGKPSTLILLTPKKLGDDGVALAAIDRDRNGTLRFEVSMGDERLWFEWFPAASVRGRSFTNGIGGTYRQERSIAIDRNWVVSRYE